MMANELIGHSAIRGMNYVVRNVYIPTTFIPRMSRGKFKVFRNEGMNFKIKQMELLI